MNWQSISFDWNQARAFLATVEEGSLSGAARALGQTQPTLGRQVTALEEELGVVLFERIGRSLELTQSGRELVEHVKAMGEAASRVSLTASGQSQTIDGSVRITASDVMAGYTLIPALEKLRQVAPLLEIDIVATNDIQDILRREADIAIRHVRPEQPELIARLIKEETASFYGSQKYLAKRGTPQTMEDLKAHDLIGFGDNARMIEYLSGIGIELSTDNFKIGSASGVVAWQMACNGLGLAIMSDSLAAQFPQMVRLVPDMKPLVFPVWLTTHRELHTSRRIRLVFDHLAEYLKTA